MKYKVNVDPENLIRIYVDKWVLKWCKEHHPEAFVEAEKFIKNLTKEDKQKDHKK